MYLNVSKKQTRKTYLYESVPCLPQINNRYASRKVICSMKFLAFKFTAGYSHFSHPSPGLSLHIT